jgi:Fe2+ or Zn2+ uptake regulation protein
MSDLQPDQPLCSFASTDARDALEKAGWRYTRQRGAVLEYLRSVHDHPTAEEIHAAVVRSIENKNISLATVYKALEALVDAGLAGKLTYADGPCRYDCRSDAHYHLRDLTTHQIRDLDTPFDPHLLDKLDPTLVEKLRSQGFHLTGYRLELVGYFQKD